MSIIGLIFLYLFCGCVICKITEALFDELSWVIFIFWPLITVGYLLLLFYFFLFKGGCKITRKVNSIRRKRMRGKND